jgi:hypothetical protein
MAFASDKQDTCNQQHDERNPCEDHDGKKSRITFAEFRSGIVSGRFDLGGFWTRGSSGLFDRIRHERLDAASGGRVVWLLLLVTSRPGHKLANSVTWPFVAVKDGIDLFSDRHLNAIARSEAECGGSGANTFSNLAAHASENIVELAAASKFDANGAVARECAGAGEHEVADAGEASECLAAAATGDG